LKTLARGSLAILFGFVALSCTGGREDSGQGITLTLYHWMEKDRSLWEEEILAPFDKAHPGVHVVLQTSPYQLYVSKSLTSIASGGALADLLLAEDWFGQELIRKNYPRNLMPFIRRDISPADYHTETWTEWRGAAQHEDELYGFPAALGLTVLFYNKDLFDRAGLPYPDTTWTYDDLIRVGKRLTVDADGDGVPEQWGLSFDVHYTGLETVIYSLGGRLLRDDSRSAALTEPATLRALQFIQDIFLKHRIASSTTSFVNPWESFVGQRAAMILIGSLGAVNLEGTSIRWDLTFPPKGPDGRRCSRRYTMAFLIPKNSAHPEEAWQLLRWILTRSPVEHIATQYEGLMPASRIYSGSAVWLDAAPVHNRRLLVALEQEYSFPLFTPAWQEWRDNNMTPELMLMIRGDKSVEQAASDAERRINAVLARVFQQ
jgi:multiple sugar transport system substrate-binding protein